MGKLRAFVLGGIVGAGVALAFAPKTGEETRMLVAEKANAIAGEAKDFGDKLPEGVQGVYNSAFEKGTEFLKDAQSKTTEVVGGAAAKVKDVSAQVSDSDSDELREKIEAARQRIAAQVMENAEKSKSDAQEVNEAVVENVESVSQDSSAN